MDKRWWTVRVAGRREGAFRGDYTLHFQVVRLNTSDLVIASGWLRP